MAEPECLSPKQAAKILEVHEDTVLALLRSGALKGFRVGRAWRITRARLNAFCEAGGQRHRQAS